MGLGLFINFISRISGLNGGVLSSLFSIGFFLISLSHSLASDTLVFLSQIGGILVCMGGK